MCPSIKHHDVFWWVRYICTVGRERGIAQVSHSNHMSIKAMPKYAATPDKINIDFTATVNPLLYNAYLTQPVGWREIGR